MIRSNWKPFYISKSLYNQKFFFFKKNFKDEEQKIIYKATRNSLILKNFNNKMFEIYNGHTYKIILVKSFMIGHKFGEFFLTRKRAVFKPKLKKK